MSDIQSSMRKTLALLETVESGGGSYLLEGGVKQVDADLRDLSDKEFLHHYKKTKAEVRKEFSSDKKEDEKETVAEGENTMPKFVATIRTLHSIKPRTVLLSAEDEYDAKDRIRYAAGEYTRVLDIKSARGNESTDYIITVSKAGPNGPGGITMLPTNNIAEAEIKTTYGIEEKPCPVCKEKELTYNQGADHLSCGGCGTGFSRADNGKWRKENTAAKKSFADMMGGSAKDLTKGLSIKESEVDEGIGKKIAHGIGKAVKKVAPNWVEKQVKADDERQAKAKKAAVDKFTSIAQKDTKKVDEDRTVEKDKEGNVVRWKEEGEWKKASGKDPRGKVTNMSDKARRETDRIKSSKK